MGQSLHPSPRSPSVLVVSNGHGEDAVGRALAEALTPAAQVLAYPLVGRGEAYRGVPLLDPRREFPSGGFALRGRWRALWADLRNGGFRHWLRQRETLAREWGRHKVIIAVGDVYCLWMAGYPRAPLVFVATAKSEHNEPYRAFERRLIRRLARVVYARDALTAQVLASTGIPARYVGNALMETIDFGGEPLALRPGSHTITLLPGSRADAYGNIPLLLRLCANVSRQTNANWLCALAPTVDADEVRRVARAEGWEASHSLLRANGIEVMLTRAFGDAIQAADIVVGLAGTANEQAAGLGKPVVAFPGPGSQFSAQFLALQGRLLGDALMPTRQWQEAAEVVLRLLHDPEERERRGRIGRARMGTLGAIETIAGEIRDWVQTSRPRRQAQDR